jgi:uncharacterized protein (TIGR03000 family)
MVLMLAMTGGVDTVDCHGHRGGGYYGGYYGGCNGGVFGAGCSGWLASSGYGGNGHGFGHGWGNGSGCWGSGFGYGSGYGCSGSGHGRRGHFGGLFGGRRHGHRGGYGCSGYGYGYGCNGGYGCTGFVSACGCGPVVVGCTGGVVTNATTTNGATTNGNKGDTGNTNEMKDKGKNGEQIGEPKDGEKKGVQNIANFGTIIVMLPADARLTVDGMATRSTSTMRTFATPTLQPGVAYHYTLMAEITRNGQTMRTERLVPVRAGQTSRVTMEFAAPTQRVASR